MLEFLALAEQCAPGIAPQTMAAIAQVESNYNPLAIGVVGGHLERQPKSLKEAVITATRLKDGGWNFSVGIAQINQSNFDKFGLTVESAFDSCANLKASAAILEECHDRASQLIEGTQPRLKAAISCYYSGNFERGFMPDQLGQPSYVQKVMLAAANIESLTSPIAIVPTYKGKTKPQKVKAAKATVVKSHQQLPRKTKRRPLVSLAPSSPIFGSASQSPSLPQSASVPKPRSGNGSKAMVFATK